MQVLSNKEHSLSPLPIYGASFILRSNTFDIMIVGFDLMDISLEPTTRWDNDWHIFDFRLPKVGPFTGSSLKLSQAGRQSLLGILCIGSLN